MLAASVKVRLMVATFFLTIAMSIHHNGGHPPGLFMSDTLRASIRACAAGRFGVYSSYPVAKPLTGSTAWLSTAHCCTAGHVHS